MWAVEAGPVNEPVSPVTSTDRAQTGSRIAYLWHTTPGDASLAPGKLDTVYCGRTGANRACRMVELSCANGLRR